MAVSGDGKQDLRGVSRLKPAEVMLSPDTVSMGNRPVGEGLTEKGDGDVPRPCLLCLWLNGIRGNTPASLLLPGYHFQVRRTLQFMEYWKKATGLGGFEPPTFSLGG